MHTIHAAHDAAQARSAYFEHQQPSSAPQHFDMA
jgi:hypothetical protein